MKLITHLIAAAAAATFAQSAWAQGTDATTAPKKQQQYAGTSGTGTGAAK